MKPYLLMVTLVTLLNVLASAQELSADEIVANLTERAEGVQDAKFLMTGNLIDADGQEIPLEVTIATIPAENLLRADFLQPDAFADNFIVVDNQDVYNYVYLTNQVSVFDLGDPEALAGLSFSSNRDFNFTLNIAGLFEGWTTSSQGLSEGVYTLRFDNNEATEGVRIGYAEAQIAEDTWLPSAMNFYSPDDVLLAELFFNDYEVDAGLNPDDVRYIDPSAEVIDER
jgi:outer membrane lipoprotein-sorting protein